MSVFQNLSILAILVATFITFNLGYLWYYKLFAKPWMAAMGLKKDDIDGSNVNIGRAMIGSVTASLATVIGVALLLQLANPVGIIGALSLGLLVWVAFSMTPVFKLIFWEDRPVMLVVIDGFYELTSIILAVLILFYWPF